MEKKENDLMMNMVANPQFSLADFASIGFNINNTSLQDASVYKNNPFIQQAFSDENGRFNDQAFQSAYQSALIGYNQMASKDFGESQLKIFHRNDISAPKSMRREGPDFRQIVISNPDQTTFGIYRLGEEGPRSRSRDEIAQANKVLLNPAEVYKNGEPDWAKAQWGDSPNDTFLGYPIDTLVLAQYDSDGEHIDPITGEKQLHRKGDLRIGENGTYYYEKLDGRDIYGRQVLNKLNVLTTDGSKWNKYDFFDSDDIEQKSVGGSIMKNLALVGTMFIPYIGPWVVGASIATQLVGLMGTLGKMFTGSESPLFSEMEGWSKSWDRQNLRTEYAQQHPWAIENWVNLVGDVSGQLKEQRFFFEKVPALFKGGYAGSNKAYAKKLDEFKKAEEKITNSKLSELKTLVDSGNKTKFDLARATQEWRKTEAIRAQGQMDSWMKGYNKIGEVFSKGYMTAITVGDTYGEAKAAGASDLDATLLTLGYAAGEYAILNTGIGEWILPELRANRYKNKAIIKAVTNLNKEGSASWKDLSKAFTNFNKDAKKQYVKNVFNIGKNIAKGEYANGTRALKATVAAGLGEGIEEVTEELLADFSKGCFNVVKWLQGEDTRLDSFGFRWDENGNRTWNGGEIWDRYGMSFFGGLIGGALTNAGTSYRMGKDLSNMSSEQAIQEIVYMARNNELDGLYKTLDKMELADKRMSATEFEKIGDAYVPKPGTETDNLDVMAKKAVRQQIQMIDNILKAEGAALSDQSFLDAQTNILGDLRFNALHNAATAGVFMQEFNSLSSDIARLVQKLNSIKTETKDTNNDGVVSDTEKRNQSTDDVATEQARKDIEKELNEKRKQLKELVEGKRSDEFIGVTLFEMNSNLHGLPVNFPMYVLKTTGKKIQDITKAQEKTKLREEYEAWMKSDGIDRIITAAHVYMDMAKQSSSVINEHNDTYRNQTQEIQQINQVLLQTYQLLNHDFATLAESNPTQAIERAKQELNSVLLSSKIGKTIIDSEITPIFQWLSSEKTRINAITDPDLKSQESKKLDIEFNEKVLEVVYNNFNKYLKPFVDQGFAHADIKNQLKQIVNTLRVYNNNQLARLEEQGVTEDTVDDSMLVTPEQATNYYKYIVRQSEFNEFEDKIDELKNTPFEENLNQFAIAIGADPINYTGLINKLDSIFNNLDGNLQDFNLEDEVLQELSNAIAVAEMYRQTIYGARVDNANLNDLFGYNKVMNDVSKKLGKELNLAEIDSQFADMLVADIDEGLNRLKFLQNLYTINQGQKLVKQQRIAVKKDILLYKGLKAIISVRDDDTVDQQTKDALTNFETVHNGLDLFATVASKKTYSLDDNEKVEFEKQKLQMEDAIYDLFKSIKDTDLTKVIKAFDIYTQSNELLNENLEELDGPSMIWYLATRAAVKSSDFYEAFRSILDNKIIPISTQEMAVYTNYAAIINGNVITQFFDAYRTHIKEDWASKTINQRIEVLKKLGKTDSNATKLAQDELIDYCFNFLPAPRYSNINFIEGAPGTGKSEAVMALTGRLLSKFHPELIKKAAFVHGANENSAKKLQKAVGIQGETFGLTQFLEKIIKQYSPYEYKLDGTVEIDENSGKYTLNEDNEIVGTHELNSTNEPFSIIFIDELSKFNLYEIDAINQYAKDHGITIITAGDLDQTGVEAFHPVTLNNQRFSVFSINLERNMFPRSPKLGVSMRTDNAIMTKDLIDFRTWMISESKEPLKLHYYFDEQSKELYGNKVIDSINGVTDEVKADIQNMIDTLTDEEKEMAEKNTNGENGPIGFIYSNPNSSLYQYLHQDNLRKYFSFKPGGTAQGLESRYYIIDASDKVSLNIADKKEIYTGISRASQGTLLFLHSNIPISSTSTNKLIKEPLGETIKQQYIAERAQILKDSVNGTVPQYNPRTSNKVKGTDQKIEDVLNLLPDTIREDVKKARENAIANPRTDLDGLLSPEQNDTDYSYGDIIEWGTDTDSEIGIIVGIGQKNSNGTRFFEVLRPTSKKENTWGYESWPVHESSIKNVLYHEKENAPRIIKKSTLSIDDQVSKWGAIMRRDNLAIEYNGRKGNITLVPIHHQESTVSGDLIDQNANIIDYNGEKIVVVKIGNNIQPFVLKNNKWEAIDNLQDMSIISSPLIDVISTQLGQQLGTTLNGIDLGPEISTNTTNGQEIIDFVKSTDTNIDSLFNEWMRNSTSIRTPIPITINDNGTNVVLNVGDKIYTQSGTLTITDIQENSGNKFIFTSGNKTYSLTDLQSKINSGLYSLHLFNSKKTIEIDGHTFKEHDTFYLNGRKYTIVNITNTGYINIESITETSVSGMHLSIADFKSKYNEGKITLFESETPQIVNQEDFDIHDLDFNNNDYIFIHETDLEDVTEYFKFGVDSWLDLNEIKQNPENIEDFLAYTDNNESYIVILEFPKSLTQDPIKDGLIPPQFIKTAVKTQSEYVYPSQSGELNLNGTIVKVGDKIINVNTNEEVQILEFKTNEKNGDEFIRVYNESNSTEEEISFHNLLYNYTTKEVTTLDHIQLNEHILKPGDIIYYDNTRVTINKILNYEEGNPRVILKFDNGTEIVRDYKGLLRAYENGILKLISTNPSEVDLSKLEHGEPPVSTVKNPKKYNQELDEANSDKQDPKLKRIVKSNDYLGVDIFLYSMNTFELGVVLDQNGEIMLDEEWSNARIDSINGLRRIDLITKNRKELRSVEYYAKWIGKLRSHILNAIDINELCNTTLKKDLGLDDLSIRFAFKTSPVWSKNNDGYVANKPNPFGKHRRERTYFNRATDSRSDEVIPHSLVAIISSTKYKDVLELPLLTLTSPVTLAQVLDENGQPAYPILYNVYESYQETIQDMKENPNKYSSKDRSDLFNKMMEEMISKINDVQEYTNVLKLFELFRYSYNGYFGIPDSSWLPSTFLHNLGSTFSINKGDKHIEEGMDFNSESESNWIPIATYKQDPSIYVTPMMKVLSNKVTIDGRSYVDLIKPGHPFVLISNDIDINTKEKTIEQWKKQQKPGYNGIQKVRLQYIQTPSLDSSKEYFEYLKAIYSAGKEQSKIRFKPGNFHTPYLILSTLLKDPNFLEIAKNRVIQYEQLKEYIDKLDSFDTTEQRHEFLISSRRDSNGNELKSKVGNFIAQSLLTIVYDITKPTLDQMNGKENPLNQEVVSLIDQVLNKENVRLYYWPNIKKNSSVGQFMEIDADGYNINGKPCLINGKIDPYMFQADMSQYLDYWTSLIKYGVELPSGVVINTTDSSGNNRYNIDNSIYEGKIPKAPIPTQISEASRTYDRITQTFINHSNPKVQKALQEHQNNYAPLLKNATNEDLKNALLDIRDRLANNGVIAFIQNNKIIIPQTFDSRFNNASLITATYQGQEIKELSRNNPLIDSISIKNENGTIDVYEASYDNGTLTLTQPIDNEPQLAHLSIDNVNFIPYIQGINTILTKLDQSLPRGIKSNPAFWRVQRQINQGDINTVEDLYDALDNYSARFKEQMTPLLEQETDIMLKQIMQELIDYNESQNPDQNLNCPIPIPIILI